MWGGSPEAVSKLRIFFILLFAGTAGVSPAEQTNPALFSYGAVSPD
jgi:hypothetical protein